MKSSVAICSLVEMSAIDDKALTLNREIERDIHKAAETPAEIRSRFTAEASEEPQETGGQTTQQLIVHCEMNNSKLNMAS